MYPFGQEVLFGFAGWDLLNVFCIQPLAPKWLKPIATKLALEQNELRCPGIPWPTLYPELTDYQYTNTITYTYIHMIKRYLYRSLYKNAKKEAMY